jgi:hypothetical protein
MPFQTACGIGNAKKVLVSALNPDGSSKTPDYIVIPIHNKHSLLVAYAGYWPGIPQSGKEKYRYPPHFAKLWKRTTFTG